MSRHKSGKKKTRYYCNEKIDNQNVYLHELCLTDPQYPDQESFADLGECIDYCYRFVNLIHPEEDQLLVKELSRNPNYNYILESFRRMGLLKYIKRQKDEFFVHLPFLSIVNVLSIFTTQSYQNSKIWVYPDYLNYDLNKKKLDDIGEITGLKDALTQFFHRISEKPSRKKTFQIVIPLSIRGDDYDIYYTDSLSFDVNQFIYKYFGPDANYHSLGSEIVDFVKKYKHHKYHYVYKYGHVILLDIYLKYYPNLSTKGGLVKSTISILDNQEDTYGIDKFYQLVENNFRKLYNQVIPETLNLTTKFTNIKSAYTTDPIQYQPDYLRDEQGRHFDVGYCEAFVSLLIYLKIMNQKTHSLLDIAEDVQNLFQVDNNVVHGWKRDPETKELDFIESYNRDLDFDRDLYPQYHTGYFGLLLLNTFILNLESKIQLKTRNNLGINLVVNQGSDLTSHNIWVDLDKKFLQQNIKDLIKKYPHYKKRLKEIFRQAYNYQDYYMGIRDLRLFSMNIFYEQFMDWSRPEIENSDDVTLEYGEL